MNFASPTSGSIATSVWSAAPRALSTAFGPLTAAHTLNQTLAAATAFTFTAGASHMRFMQVSFQCGAAGAVVIQTNDGTRNYQASSTAANGQGVSPLFMLDASLQVVLSNNDAVNPIPYAYMILDFA